MIQKETRLATLALLGLTTAASVQAEIVNIDITTNPNAGPTGTSLAGVIGNADGSNTWNSVNDTALRSSLLNKDGLATGLSFQLTGTLAATEAEVINPNEFFINPLAEVNVSDVFFETYAWVSGENTVQDTSSFTIGGLSAGETADLYLYATWPFADTGSEFRLSSDGGTTWTGWQLVDGTPSEGNAAFAEGSSYTLFEDVAGHTDGTILGEWRSIPGEANRHRGMFNALQIESSSGTEQIAAMGTPYSWLEDNGFNTDEGDPSVADQEEVADPDNDGRLTWYEYQTGTDPNLGTDFAGIDVPDKPNIVLVMIDDAGLGDFTSFHASSPVHTPTLSQIADQGMTFHRAYSGAPYCAPARSSLMTGKHLGHAFLRGNLGGTSIREGEVTVAEVLRQAGYATGGFGKWGIGAIGTPGVPERNGFDLFYGYYHQVHAHDHYPTYLYRNSVLEQIPGNSGAPSGFVPSQYTHTQNLFVDEMKQFIKSNATTGKRFFAYGPWNPPHQQHEIPADDPANPLYAGKSWNQTTKIQAAFITMIDRQLGELLELLDDPNEDGSDSDSILAETLVVLMSDNGGTAEAVEYSRNPGLRGAKGSVYEGGIRVPMFAYWPGVVPAGYRSQRLTYFPDFIATFAELGRVTSALPEIDGVSFAGHLTGRSMPKNPPFLYFEQRSQDYGGGTYGSAIPQAVVRGEWKAVRSDLTAAVELYNLTVDPSESTDVAASNPIVAGELEAILDAEHEPEWPQYDPSDGQPRWEIDFGVRAGEPVFTVANASFEEPALVYPTGPNNGRFAENSVAWSGGFVQNPGNVVLDGGGPLFSGALPDGVQAGGINGGSSMNQDVLDANGQPLLLHYDDLFLEWQISLHLGRRLATNNAATDLRVELVGSSSNFAYFSGSVNTGSVTEGTFAQVTVSLAPTDIPGGYQSGDDLGQPLQLRLTNTGSSQVFLDLVQLSGTPWQFTPAATSSGVPHWWFETTLGVTSDLENQQFVDHDGDGQDAVFEYRANTDPLDSSDNLRIVSIVSDPDPAGVTLDFSAKPDRVHRIAASTDLEDWSDITGDLTTPVEAILSEQIDTAGTGNRFFRVEAHVP